MRPHMPFYSEHRLLDCINTALAADAFAQLACRDEQEMKKADTSRH